MLGCADLHIHTTASDGFDTVQAVLEHVAALGTLNVIAITDHDILEGSLWAYEHRARYPFDIIPGLEVTSIEGHVLALWVTNPIPAGMSLAETTAAIHEQAGVAILAHPFELTITYRVAGRYLRQPESLLDTGIDAVEVYNAASPTPASNLLAARMAKKIHLPGTGGSDAHSLGGIGCGITRFQGRTATDLRQALLAGQTQGTGHPWPLREYLRYIPSCSKLDRLNSVASFGRRLLPFSHSTRA